MLTSRLCRRLIEASDLELQRSFVKSTWSKALWFQKSRSTACLCCDPTHLFVVKHSRTKQMPGLQACYDSLIAVMRHSRCFDLRRHIQNTIITQLFRILLLHSKIVKGYIKKQEKKTISSICSYF